MPEPNYKAFLLRQSFCPVWKKNSCVRQEEKITACMTYSHQQSWDATFGKRKTAGNQRDIPALTDLRSGPLMEPFIPPAVKQGVGILVEDTWLGSFPSAEREETALPSSHKICLLSLDLHHNTCRAILLVVGIGVDGAGYTCSLNFFFASRQFTVLETSMETK